MFRPGEGLVRRTYKISAARAVVIAVSKSPQLVLN